MKHKEAKTEALNRKKEEKATDNGCPRCGGSHSLKEHGKKNSEGKKEEKFERESDDEAKGAASKRGLKEAEK